MSQNILKWAEINDAFNIKGNEITKMYSNKKISCVRTGF